MTQFFGFELLFNSVKGDLKEKHELVVVVFHWFLIREGFLCLGVGTERELLDSDIPTELLPEGWNSNQETFFLRYFNAELQKVVVLDVTVPSAEEVAVAIAGGDDSSSTKGITLSIPRYLADFDAATNTKTKIQHMMPRIDEVMYKFQKIYEEFTTPILADKSILLEQRETRPPVPHIPPMYDPYNTYPGLLPDETGPFGGIGRRDLDPFSGGGGGMLVPNRPNRPSVRYDPVGPTPSFDHLPPPGGSGFDMDPESFLLRNPNRRPQQRPAPPGPGSLDWYA